MWLITNKDLAFSDFCKNIFHFNGFTFITDNDCVIEGDEQYSWFYEGYILPRQKISMEFSKFASNKLPGELFGKFGDQFPRQIKGNFILIQLYKNGFKIYSDRFGIKKFFYWQQGKKFLISNVLKSITSNINVMPSAGNMAIYSLTYHFVGGETIFKDIYYNKPAEIIGYNNGSFSFSTYWNPGELLNLPKRNIGISEIADTLTKSVKQSLDYSKSEKISLSLTAGVDSRILFSILLNLNIKIHAYTYGDANSIDCTFAKKLAYMRGVPHTVHEIEFDKDSFAEYAEKSISIGHSLTSIHRAHRIKAIEEESNFADTMFLGTMGGEFVKGASHDDYIISDFIFEFSRNPQKDVLLKYLLKKEVNINHLDVDSLMIFFQNQNWCKYPQLVDFYGLFEIAAGLHHAQNDIHYNYFFNFVFTPYLDIDYLEILFQSGYNFLVKNNYYSKFRKRLENHKFSSDIQCFLSPELAALPYNSGFVPREFKINRYYALFKSIIRKKLWDYNVNLPLGTWMDQYVTSELKKIKQEKGIISEVNNIDNLILSLGESKNISTESYWLKYTTPIQMNLTIKNFCN